MPNMIFHIPFKINKYILSGSQIRPLKMLKAFQDIGYSVDIVMGDGKERAKQIKRIKNQINSGKKYNFLYSESSTYPTLLASGKLHAFFNPMLDFNFFKFCRKKNIPIALFYRDIHWRFPHFKTKKSNIKRILFYLLYNIDLFYYKKNIDILFLPHMKMLDFIPLKFNTITSSLPPAAATKNVLFLQNQFKPELSFLYIGGVGELYDLRLFVKVISNFKNSFILCLRKKEWEINRDKYTIPSNVKIVNNTSQSELDNLYLNSSVAVLFVRPSTYWSFAMPVKLFEYISYNKPIIAVKNTAAGDFIEKHDIGWSLEYSYNKLTELIHKIQKNTNEIEFKTNNIKKIFRLNTWKARAEKVIIEIEKNIH